MDHLKIKTLKVFSDAELHTSNLKDHFLECIELST